MNSDTRITLIPTEDLHFDHRNPRLSEYGIDANTLESDILKILWDAMDVRELVQSIAASGFFLMRLSLSRTSRTRISLSRETAAWRQ